MNNSCFISFVLVLTAVLFAACKSKPSIRTNQIPVNMLQASYAVKNKAVPITPPDTLTKSEIEDETATYYIVVADTSADYYALRDEMQHVHRTLNISIDTMGRHYNTAKKLIALPDNDSDEIYAGDYFPRRFPSNFMSLEYMNFYQTGSAKQTIALVSGIYEKQSSADSALKILKSTQNNSFAIKASIYIGCIH